MFWELVSWFGELYFFLLVIAIFTWYGQKKKAIGLTCLLILESGLTMGMKLFFRQPRLEGSEEITYSFPSGHTSKAGSLAGFLLGNRTGWILLLPLFVGVSRVMLGEHVWIDVLAGGSFGILLGFVFRKLWNRLPVIEFGRHHRVFFIVLSVVAFLLAVYLEFRYINYTGAITGLAIGFLIPEERASGKDVIVSGLVGFVLLLVLIYLTVGYTNFFLNFFLGLWISVLNPWIWEVLNRQKP